MGVLSVHIWNPIVKAPKEKTGFKTTGYIEAAISGNLGHACIEFDVDKETVSILEEDTRSLFQREPGTLSMSFWPKKNPGLFGLIVDFFRRTFGVQTDIRTKTSDMLSEDPYKRVVHHRLTQEEFDQAIQIEKRRQKGENVAVFDPVENAKRRLEHSKHLLEDLNHILKDTEKLRMSNRAALNEIIKYTEDLHKKTPGEFKKKLDDITALYRGSEALCDGFKGMTLIDELPKKIEYWQHAIENTESTFKRLEKRKLEYKNTIDKHQKRYNELKTWTTKGRHADFEIKIPFKGAAYIYGLNIKKVIKKMEAQHTQEKYKVLHYNCASAVKSCLLAGIDEDLKKTLQKTCALDEKFFKIRDKETPLSVKDWAMQLENYLMKLNFPQSVPQKR